jgi:hypothetical protein
MTTSVNLFDIHNKLMEKINAVTELHFKLDGQSSSQNDYLSECDLHVDGIEGMYTFYIETNEDVICVSRTQWYPDGNFEPEEEETFSLDHNLDDIANTMKEFVDGV